MIIRVKCSKCIGCNIETFYRFLVVFFCLSNELAKPQRQSNTFFLTTCKCIWLLLLMHRQVIRRGRKRTSESNTPCIRPTRRKKRSTVHSESISPRVQLYPGCNYSIRQPYEQKCIHTRLINVNATNSNFFINCRMIFKRAKFLLVPA